METPARRGTSRVAAECWKMTPRTIRLRPCVCREERSAVHTPKSASPAARSPWPHPHAARPRGSPLEAGIAIEAFLKRRVISGELKLVFPFELQRDFVEREGRRGQRDEARTPQGKKRSRDMAQPGEIARMHSCPPPEGPSFAQLSSAPTNPSWSVYFREWTRHPPAGNCPNPAKRWLLGAIIVAAAANPTSASR